MIKPNILPISNTGMTIFTEVMLISLIFFMFLDQKIRAVKKKNMSIYITFILYFLLLSDYVAHLIKRTGVFFNCSSSS